MNPKSHFPFENDDPKVKELQTYLRWSRRLFYALIAVMVVNLILTYGLIFHPSRPSITTCAQYCPSIQAGETMSSVLFSADSVAPKDMEVREAESTDLVARSVNTELAELDARWNYGDVRVGIALAMGGYWVTNQAIQWWNMVSACQDFSSASNTINCLWGAVSTVITASGTLYGAYVGVGHISTWMSNNGISMGGFKRSEPTQGLLDEFANVFGSPVTHLGHWDSASHAENSSIDTRDTEPSLRDVFHFNSNGMDMHFSYLGNQTNGPTFKFGYGKPTSESKLKRQESYDVQYFASGGIDFVLFENPDSYDYPSGALDASTDFSWIYDQVSCIMASGMSAAGHWFQIYDNVHDGTLAAGAVAPFSGLDHWSVITQMEAPKGGLSVSSSCDPTNKVKREFQA